MQLVGGTLVDALSSLFDTRSDIAAATKAEALDLMGEVLDGKLPRAALQACASQGGFNLIDVLVGPAYAGVCEQYSREAIDLCLDGLDKLRSAIAPYGAPIVDYFADRIAADPDGFAKAMRALDLLPSGLIMDQFAAEARQAFERSGGRVEDLADAMGTFLAKQLVALGNGEFSPEVATGLIAAAVIASMKFVSKDARAGFTAKISDTVRELYGAVKGANRAQLIDDLVRGGTKITPANVVDIRRLPDGRTVWIEIGSDSAGLQHIYKRHEVDFVNKGIPREKIQTVVMNAIEQGSIVGTNGSANVYRTIHNGVEQYIAIGIGSNGFVVRANPVSTWKPLP
ncbi:filamentous hemagglutinin [Chelatococcus caeni]|uniref:Filamentous hemagglutinin n=1 Tax=Chelatococcus caeni TaxID=1348468 RepID=A0A840C3D7_9HYPH|nr:hypothetical protein [Chelatococcus caeni]MBB4017446.1 filamentous hemagglutinin [Chelatococcus caeni]